MWVFQPLADGKSSRPCVVFDDGFAGAVKEGEAAHRPTGLAVGPDSALYISDDQHGRIWRVTYRGPATAVIAAAPAPVAAARSLTAAGEPPEGIHPDAGAQAGRLPTPTRAMPDEVALGDRIYYGQVGGAPCEGCHGTNAKGTPLAPDLTSNKWLWGEGSLASITQIITNGVPNPKNYRSPMPPKGGAQLSPRRFQLWHPTYGH
jgi:mono/diheme cytochrome c family protein